MSITKDEGVGMHFKKEPKSFFDNNYFDTGKKA